MDALLSNGAPGVSMGDFNSAKGEVAMVSPRKISKLGDGLRECYGVFGFNHFTDSKIFRTSAASDDHG